VAKLAEASYLTDTGYALHAQATIGNIGSISIDQANHELEQVHYADDRADAFLGVLAAHDIVSGDALQGVMDMVHGYNEELSADDILPVAALLRTRFSGGRVMAIVGRLNRTQPFDARVADDMDNEVSSCLATAALGLDGFMQAIKGESKATGSQPDQPGRTFIDVVRYTPVAGSELVEVDHKTALVVAAGAEALPMLEAHDFGAFGRFAFDTLGIS
jgi:hypothetical protein